MCLSFPLSDPEEFTTWIAQEAEAAHKRHESQQREWRSMQIRRDDWWGTQDEGAKQKAETAEVKFPPVGTAVVSEADVKETAGWLGEPECYFEPPSQQPPAEQQQQQQ